MKADLHCSHCEISYFVRWNPLDFNDGGVDPLEEAEDDSYPEFCPFCGSPAEDEA